VNFLFVRNVCKIKEKRKFWQGVMQMFTVGILGGMGPMATVDFFEKIVRCTPAHTDQEHLKIIIYNNPQIPSRVDAVIKATESPRDELIRSAQLLENMGADFLVMPCNTAHYWYQDIKNATNIKMINMVENTAKWVAEQAGNKNIEEIMLFASDATVKAEMYQKVFATKGLTVLTPNTEEQRIITLAIEQVKAGYIEKNQLLGKMGDIISGYCIMGIRSFIAGCTEIPLLFKYLKGDYNGIDPTLLLAKEVVRYAIKG
jgi:aspartate racemase